MKKIISFFLVAVLTLSCINYFGVTSKASETYTNEYIYTVNTDTSTEASRSVSYTNIKSNNVKNNSSDDNSNYVDYPISKSADPETGESLTKTERHFNFDNELLDIDEEDIKNFKNKLESLDTTEYSVGDTKSFNTEYNSNYTQATTSIQIECRYIANNCTVWVSRSDSEAIQLSDNQCQQIAENFDSNWARELELFGNYIDIAKVKGNNFFQYGDADLDGKVAIICYDIDGEYAAGGSVGSYTGGYYFSLDNFIDKDHAYITSYENSSNLMDCIHIDTFPSMGSSRSNPLSNIDTAFGTLYHEGQHLIQQSYGFSLPQYLNEGFSMAAEHSIMGDPLSNSELYTQRINSFNGQTVSGYTLTYFSGSFYDYAGDYVFTQYLRTQYKQTQSAIDAGDTTGETFYKQVLRNYKTAITNAYIIEDSMYENVILNLLGRSDYVELVKDFWRAVMLKAPSGKYGFAKEKWSYELSPYIRSTSSGSKSVKNGGCVFYKVNGSVSIDDTDYLYVGTLDSATIDQYTITDTEQLYTGDKKQITVTPTSDATGPIIGAIYYTLSGQTLDKAYLYIEDDEDHADLPVDKGTYNVKIFTYGGNEYLGYPLNSIATTYDNYVKYSNSSSASTYKSSLLSVINSNGLSAGTLTIFSGDPHNVTFKSGLDWSTTTKIQENVSDASEISPPSASEVSVNGYTLIGWEGDTSKIASEDITLNAIYAKIDTKREDGNPVTVTTNYGSNLSNMTYKVTNTTTSAVSTTLPSKEGEYTVVINISSNFLQVNHSITVTILPSLKSVTFVNESGDTIYTQSDVESADEVVDIASTLSYTPSSSSSYSGYSLIAWIGDYEQITNSDVTLSPLLAKAVNKEYDGTSLEINTNISNTVTWTYSKSTSSPTNVGTYAVNLSNIANTNYIDLNAELSAVISKATIQSSDISITSTFTYDGTAKTPTITASLINNAAYTVTYYSDSAYTTKTTPSRTTVGSTIYYFTIEDKDSNYNVYKGNFTLTVNSESIVYTKSNGTYTYDGNNHYGTVTVTKPLTGAVITYSLEQNGTYTASPEVKKAGTYTLWFKIVATNYTSVTDSLTVTINKKDMPEIEDPKTTSFTYDGLSHSAEVTLPTLISGNTSSVTYSSDNKTYSSSPVTITNYSDSPKTVYYKVTSSQGNYNDYTGSFKISITKATIKSSDISIASTYSYDGTAKSPAITASLINNAAYTVKYYSSSSYAIEVSPSKTNAGSYNFYYTLVDNNGNYNTYRGGSITLKINKIDMPEIEDPKTTSFTYDGSSHSAEVTLPTLISGNTSSVTYSSDNETFSSSPVTITNYSDSPKTVYYKVTSSQGNYNDYTGSFKISITKATIKDSDLNVTSTYTYDGTTKSPVITANLIGNAAYTLTYYSNSAYTSEISTPQMTDVGSKLYYFTISDNNGNYEVYKGQVLFIVSESIISYTKSNITSDYDGNSHLGTITVSEPTSGYTITYSSSKNGTYSSSINIINAGVHTVWFKISASNYPEVVDYLTVTINKIAIKDEDVSVVSEYEYDGTAKSPVVTASLINSAEYTVTYYSDSEYATQIDTPTMTDSGSETYYYTITDKDNNYETYYGVLMLEVIDESSENIDIYRLYNTITGEHLFTAKINEYNKLGEIGWIQEGKTFIAYTADDKPDDAVAIYRLFNPNGFGGQGDHHYTKSQGEITKLLSAGWKLDFSGVPAFYVRGDINVYKLYNPTTGAHHYTPKQGEANKMSSSGWKKEGISWTVEAYYNNSGDKITK